jgi:hypothetical protein
MFTSAVTRSSRVIAGAHPPALAAFGLSLRSEGPPPGAWQARPLHEPSLQIRFVTAAAIEDSWSGVAAIGWEGVIDGAPFVVERGIDGDHRFVHGTHPESVHHLSADASVLQCAPPDPAEKSWWRVVLDSVLFTVALLQGYEALHAGAIATPDGAIAITAASGGGKSTLLSELIARGQTLMADDVLVLEPRGTETPLAYPAAPLMTVPAIRLRTLGETVPPETICSIDDERWIAMRVHPEPQLLKALVVLDRRHRSQLSGSETSLLKKIDDPLAPLLGSLMNFPSTPERQRKRFELASALAAKTALWRLTADLDTPPDILADALLSSEL